METQLAIDFSTRPATARQPERPRKMTVGEKIHALLKSGGAWTYSELQAKLGGTETAISARLRELKQDGLAEKRQRSRNLWEWFAVGHGNSKGV